MSEHRPERSTRTSDRPAFDERLSVPLWWYLPAVGVAVLLGAEVHMGYPGLRSWIGYAVLVPLFVLVLVRMGRTRVRVDDAGLHVGDEVLDRSRVGRVETITGRDDKQTALGPQLDPAAFLLHRAWVRPVVRVEVVDPHDGIPYWIFSVRDPERLRAALDR